MYTKNILAAATLAAAASAQIALPQKRDYIEARQTLDGKCQDAIQSIMPIYSEIPTPPAALTSMAATLTDPCQMPAFTGDLQSEYASYTSGVSSWYSAHSSELLAALASCPALQQYASSVPICTKTDMMSGGSSMDMGTMSMGSGTASSKAAGTATGTAKSTATVVQTAGASREGGMYAAVIAAAGFVGAVAAL